MYDLVFKSIISCKIKAKYRGIQKKQLKTMLLYRESVFSGVVIDTCG
jgi:hypothetical protein